MTKRRVVVTGMAITSPHGSELRDNFHAWVESKSNFTAIDLFSPTMAAAPYGGQCPHIDTTILKDRKVQKAILRKDLIGLTTALKAWHNGNLQAVDCVRERLGMYVGVASTQVGDLMGYRPLLEECGFDSKAFGTGLLGGVNPMILLHTLMNNTLCYTSAALDIRGPNANFLDLQSAGLRAVIEGIASIQYDRCDAVLAGGVAGSVEPVHAAEAIRLGWLAKTAHLKQDETDKIVMPYDQKRCGSILSEGAAFITLEAEEFARKRDANILGYVSDFALSGEGVMDFQGTERPLVFENMLRRLLAKDVGAEVGLIIGQGSGSPSADRAELETFLHLFDRGRTIPILHSAKGVFGEMTEASGVLNLILALHAFSQNEVPCIKNFHNSEIRGARKLISSACQKLDRKVALITSHSFSGVNCAVTIAMHAPAKYILT